MNHHLSRDEFEALEQVSQAKSFDKPSACIARNGKRLVGIKMLSYRKNGTYELTPQGAEALFVKDCIVGLRAVAAGSATRLDARVATFLVRKSYVTAVAATPGRFAISDKGRECLVDIDASADKGIN